MANQVRQLSIKLTALGRIDAIHMLCYDLSAAAGSAGGVKGMIVAAWPGWACCWRGWRTTFFRGAVPSQSSPLRVDGYW
jgi:hypothetical protein